MLNSTGYILDFDEGRHIYSVNGEEYTSVTTHVKSYCEDFDADKVAAKMAAMSLSKTESDYKEEWRAKAEYGTSVHKEIENYFSGIDNTSPSIEFKYFLELWPHVLEKYPEYTAIHSELRMFCPRRKLAGTADLVMVNTKGDAIILDWKTSKKIYTKPYSGNAVCKPPFDFLPLCNYSAYKLQLNHYRDILEEWYGVVVRGMAIVVLNTVNPNAICYDIEYIEV